MTQLNSNNLNRYNKIAQVYILYCKEEESKHLSILQVQNNAQKVLLDSKTKFVRERIWRKLVTIIPTIKFNTSKFEQAK